jgi:type II secretory pathway pseudopilin PulG
LGVERWAGETPALPCRAFTMVELALSIAVVAIAMVAIIGVMPLGLNAQKDNRDDTIVNQDAQFFLETLRSGNVRVDELTNFVDFITVSSITKGKTNSRTYYHVLYDKYGNLSDLPNPVDKITSGSMVVGLLSLPKREVINGTLYTNQVVAQMRALSGSLFEKPSRVVNEVTPTNSFDSAFRYRLTTEVVPIVSVDPRSSSPQSALRLLAMRNNLYELRLTFQWPVHQLKGRTVIGPSYKTYRTQMAGRLRLDRTNSPKEVVLEYLEPDRYSPPVPLP